MEITKEDLQDIKFVIAEFILELKKQEQYGINTKPRRKHLLELMKKVDSLMFDYQLVKLGED